MTIYVMDIETPWLDIDVTQTVVDEEGHESEVTNRVTTGPGGRCSLLEFRYATLRCEETDAQQHEQIIPDPNLTMRRVWVVLGEAAAQIQADEDMTVYVCEEVEHVGQKPSA